MLNKVLLLGYLASVPEAKQENGVCFTKFDIVKRLRKMGKAGLLSYREEPFADSREDSHNSK